MASFFFCSLLLVLIAATPARPEKFPKVEAFFQGHCNQLSPCHQRCLDLPSGGYECACWEGFKLHSNGFTCLAEKAIQDSEKAKHAGADKVSAEEDNADKDLEAQLPPSSDHTTSQLTEPTWDEILRTSADQEEPLKEEIHKVRELMQGDAPQRADDVMLGDQPYQFVDGSHDQMEKRGEHRGGRRKGGRRRKQNKNKFLEDDEDDNDSPVADSAMNPNENNYHTPDEPDNNKYDYDKSNKKQMIKFRTCDDLRCHAGGRCVPDEMRGGVRCQCRLGNAGEFCERVVDFGNVVVRYPKFVGTGYMGFPVLRGAYKEFTIQIDFRPDTGNGLLLFSGEHATARSDFFSISLVDGHIDFRFDCGTGLAQIISQNQVELSAWNTLTVHRNDWNGWLQLNEGPQAKGRSKGLYSRITFREDLYLGGYRNNSLIGARTGMQWGFVGCVRKLEINGKIYDMRKGAFVGDAIHGIDVGECSAHVCDSIKCHNGGTCHADSPDTHVCLCPLGSAGDRCENKIDIHVPFFTGQSFLQYIGLRRTVLSFAEIEIVFKATDPNGMLLYNGYTTDRSGDFIALSLIDGFVDYRFDLGTGAAIIRSRQPISLNEWHVVRISRTGRDGYMQLDNQASVEGMSKGAYTQLTLTLDLFVGGHRNFDEVAKNAGTFTSFKGCIQKVVINERPLKLMEEAINGVNIDNCNHPCVGQPCLNGGRCIPMRDFYKCSCPLGFENTNCEDKLKNPIRTPMFTGDSYLMYVDPFILQRVRGKKIDIQMRIRATGPDGLLFWTGEEVMTQSSDYLALGIKNGHVTFGYNLGSGEILITYNESRIDDGSWHKIRAQRYEKIGYLEIDGTEVIEGTAPGNLKQLNTRNKVFVGGMDDIVHNSYRKFTSGFVGCISNITLATDYHMDLIGEAADGQNIRQCV